jgi:anti-sigma B factor antagonist
MFIPTDESPDQFGEVIPIANELLVVRRTREGGVERLTPIGELDIATVPILERAFEGAFEDGEVRMIVVDLTELAFMDSTGLHALLRLAEACRAADRLRVVGGSHVVERLFDLSGVRDQLPIIGSDRDPLVPLAATPARQESCG